MANIDNKRESLAIFFYVRLLMRLLPPFCASRVEIKLTQTFN